MRQDHGRNQNQANEGQCQDFIAAVDNDTRRADARTLLKLFANVSGWKAKMWGPTIIGFGAYHYAYDTGHCGSGPADLLKKLGKHKGGLKQCLYINKLDDVDLAVLQRILEAGLVEAGKQWPVTAS